MAAGPSQTQYRDKPGERLRVTPPGRATKREMIVSTYSEASLVVRLKGQRLVLRAATFLIVMTAVIVSVLLMTRG